MPERVKSEVDDMVSYDDHGGDYLALEDAVRWFYGRVDEETARWAAARLLHDVDRGGEFPLETPPASLLCDLAEGQRESGRTVVG